MSFYRRTGKRCLDLTLALPVALLALPICVAIAVVIRLTMGTPVLFFQERPGLGAKPFSMVKFRSMRKATGSDGEQLADADRLTALGRFLRATSLDELPSLWQVITGEMSLVGPRPLLPSYLGRYSPRQARRHEVRPGVTGWAQVNGRNAIDWPEKLELDVWYVDHLTLSLDLRILARTLSIALTARGVSAPGEATMPEFMGEERDQSS